VRIGAKVVRDFSEGFLEGRSDGELLDVKPWRSSLAFSLILVSAKMKLMKAHKIVYVDWDHTISHLLVYLLRLESRQRDLIENELVDL